MGFSDSNYLPHPWKVSISAKAERLVTAEIHVASPGGLEKKGFLSFLAKIRRRRSLRHPVASGICDASLRVRARIFFFKATLAAGRLRELHARALQCNLIRYDSSGEAPVPAHSSSFRWFKGFFRSSSSTKSFLPPFFPRRNQKKGSFLVYGAGIGAFVLFALHHATSGAAHFPSLAWNAGSRLIGLFERFARRKCDSAGFNATAYFWQGAHGALSLLQMVVSLVRPIFFGSRFVNTALLAMLIGTLLMGRADKVQDFIGGKTQGRPQQVLKSRMLMKLLTIMQLIKRFGAHISMIQACIFLLFLAVLTSAVSGLEEMA